MSIETHLAIHAAIIVIKRIPWWFYAGLAVALVPPIWQAYERDQELLAKSEAILAMPPPALEDLALDSANRLGSSGTEVALRAQVIDELSGTIDQKVGSLDVSKFVIFLAPPNATDVATEVVAAIVVPKSQQPAAEDWLNRQTTGTGKLGPIIELSGQRADASVGVAQTKLVNLFYPGVAEEFRTVRTVDLGDGKTGQISDFDSAGYQARIASLTSRFIGIKPFFDGREAALSPASRSAIRPYQGYFLLLAFLLTLTYGQWRRRALVPSQSSALNAVNRTVQRWITIFCGIWLFTALSGAYDIGRIGDVGVKILILIGSFGYVGYKLLSDPKYAHLTSDLKKKVKSISDPLPTFADDPRPQPVRRAADPPPRKPTDPFGDSPIKTTKGWFR